MKINNVQKQSPTNAVVRSSVIAAAAMICLGLAGCDSKDGPMEKAGEAVDEAVSDVAETVEEAGDEVEKAADEVEDKVTN